MCQALAVVLALVAGQRDRPPLSGFLHLHHVIAAGGSHPAVTLEQCDRPALAEELGTALDTAPTYGANPGDERAAADWRTGRHTA